MQIHLLFLALFAAITHAAILPFTQIPLTEPPTQLDICPELEVTCVLDGDWRHPVGKLGKKPFCRKGIRCNQCYEEGNTRECNRRFKECGRACEAYGPIPF